MDLDDAELTWVLAEPAAGERGPMDGLRSAKKTDGKRMRPRADRSHGNMIGGRDINTTTDGIFCDVDYPRRGVLSFDQIAIIFESPSHVVTDAAAAQHARNHHQHRVVPRQIQAHRREGGAKRSLRRAPIGNGDKSAARAAIAAYGVASGYRTIGVGSQTSSA